MDGGLPWADVSLNVVAILLSMLATFYMVRIYRRIYKKNKAWTTGWQWLFVASLGVLLFNLSSLYILFNAEDVAIVFGQYGLDLDGIGFFRVVDVRVLETFNVLGRTILVFAMTVGAYLLYAPMQEGVQYSFIPVKPALEKRSESERRYVLEKGVSTLVWERRPTRSMRIFHDHVTHGVHGLLITRRFPDKIREEEGLEKTPIVWLSREGETEHVIRPGDLISFSHTIREFIKKTDDGIVLIDGLEYLILQNSFMDVLKSLQSLNDSAAQSKSRIIIPVDAESLDEQQKHLLAREFPDVDGLLK